MKQFILNGGFPTIVILLLSVSAIVNAVRFALQPDARKLGILKALSAAIAFGGIAGLFANLSAVFHFLTQVSAAERAAISAQGFHEALSTPVLAFGILMLVWILIAVGARKAAKSPLG